jgi:hypothetical protein
MAVLTCDWGDFGSPSEVDRYDRRFQEVEDHVREDLLPRLRSRAEIEVRDTSIADMIGTWGFMAGMS